MRSPDDLYALAWPQERVGEAVEALARRAKLSSGLATAPLPPERLSHADEATLNRWLQEVIAAHLGIEAEPVDAAFTEVERMARGAAPAVLRLPPREAGGPLRFLALLSGGRRLTLIGPDLRTAHVASALVRDAMRHHLIAPFLDLAEQLLTEAGVPVERRARAGLAAVEAQLGAARLRGGWLLRPTPGASLWPLARAFNLFSPLALLAAAEIAQQALTLLAWWVIGQGALAGSFDRAGLQAWALLLFTAIPFQMLMIAAQGQFAIRLGSLFKQRLLYGILRLMLDETRHQGLGQFLGRVMEAEAVEMLALANGLTALVAIAQLASAFVVLALGAGGWPHAALLAACALAALVLGWRYFRHAEEWGQAHRAMTNDLVERMVGHRTRLAQEERARWHVEEDRELERYLNLSARLDRTGMMLAAIPRAWMLAGLAGLAYAFARTGAPPATASLAISLGGLLLGLQALTAITSGAQVIAQVAASWSQVGPLFEAAGRPAALPPAGLLPAGEGDQPLAVMKDVTFRYHEHARPALRECALQIRRGDRVLLEGPSGGGKSTLAAVLAGLRAPVAGLLLLRGYDRHTLGEDAWRRRITVAPQFHENHLFTETFGFNLLMGRNWPPTDSDLAEAETICAELGLSDLLNRMPSREQQMVGESGWRLSHGERSRVFIARALLQQADVVILDESFGALDPENLARALHCARRRAPTLLVIAHP